MVSHERHEQLVCIRVRWPVSKEDMTRFFGDLQRTREESLKAGMPPAGFIVVDLRSGDVVPQEAAQGFLGAMKSDHIQRLAVITKPEAAIQNLQAKRLVREAGEGRQMFNDAAEARSWLAESLGPADLAALDRFLTAG